MKSVSPETFAAQGGGLIEPLSGAIVPPIHISTTLGNGISVEVVSASPWIRDRFRNRLI